MKQRKSPAAGRSDRHEQKLEDIFATAATLEAKCDPTGSVTSRGSKRPMPVSSNERKPRGTGKIREPTPSASQLDRATSLTTVQRAA
jgi:hypothetical protein